MHIDEVKNNQFYQFPQWLFEEPYNVLSHRAMLMYMLLFDRRNLSVKNKWFDDNGQIYVYFTNEQFTKVLKCSNKVVVSSKKELHEVGLLNEVRQGVNKPNRLYIYGSVKDTHQEVSEVHNGSVKDTHQEVSEVHTINTDINQTNISRLIEPDNNNNTNIIYSAFEREFGRLLSPMEIEEVGYMIKDNPEELVLEALREAVLQHKPTIRYIKGILKNWRLDSLTTVEQVRANQEQRSRNRKSRDSNFEYDEQYNFEKYYC